MDEELNHPLNDLHIIGKGNERVVFLHPEDNTKVLKITHNQLVSRMQNDIESIYFEHLARKKITCPHIPAYFGKINTESGVALVFEKIENADGTRAPQLDELIRERLLTHSDIKKNLKTMYRGLLKNNIVFTDISPKNIVCKKKEDGEVIFVVVDGFGPRHKSFKLWLYIHVGIYAKYKIYKQFSRLFKKIDDLMSHKT